MHGLWLGLGIGYIAAFFLNLVCTDLIKKKSNQNLDPILLFNVEAEARQLIFNVKNTQEEIMECVYEIDKKLKSIEGFSVVRRNRITLMVEENCMGILEKIPNDVVNIEINIIWTEQVQEPFSLIIRNDFITPDSTDPNIKISSFRDYVLANMVVLSNDMYYLLKKEETTVAYKI